jgi:hypothetical protein
MEGERVLRDWKAGEQNGKCLLLMLFIEGYKDARRQVATNRCVPLGAMTGRSRRAILGRTCPGGDRNRACIRAEIGKQCGKLGVHVPCRKRHSCCGTRERHWLGGNPDFRILEHQRGDWSRTAILAKADGKTVFCEELNIACHAVPRPGRYLLVKSTGYH